MENNHVQVFRSLPRREAVMNATTKTARIRLTRSSPACWRITFANPPLNLMDPEFVVEFRPIMTAIETDEELKVVVFESAVDGFFLNHSDFSARLEDLTNLPQGPTGLEAWPDILVRLTRAPVVSIAAIRGRAQVTEARSLWPATCVSPAGRKRFCRNGKWAWAWSPAAGQWRAFPG
jgi:hypothetical protein